MKLLPLVSMLGVPLLVWTQVQRPPQLVDKKGQFAMWFSEASSEYPDKDTILFDVSGNPVHGYSKAQNLDFSALNMTGKIRKTADGSMHLTNGVVTGSGKITVTDKGGKSTLTMAKGILTDDGDRATIDIPSPLIYTNTSTSADGTRSMVLTGTKGTFILKSLANRDDNPLSSAEINGPVEIVINQNSNDGKKRLYSLSGQNVTMRADGLDKIVTISGSVHLSSEETGGENPGFMGDMHVSSATVTFDKNYLVKTIKTKAPGTGSVAEKKDGL